MAIAFDAKVNSGEKTAVSSITQALTVGTLNSGILIVCSQVRNDANITFTHISGITYNSVALTLAKLQDGPAASRFCTSEIWYLKNPASGAHNIVVTYAASVGIAVIGGISFSGVDQGNPVEATQGGTNATSPFTVSITTLSNNAWIVGSIYTSDDVDITPSNSETVGWDINTNGVPGDRACAEYRGPISPAGATTTGWTDGVNVGTDDTAQTAIALRPAGIIKFRKTLSSLGTGVGKRQLQG